MLQELINKTNTEDFYSNGNLYPISIKGQIGGFDTTELKFVIEETGFGGIEENYMPWKKVEYWKIIAHKAIQFNNLFTALYMPYVKLRLIDEHPLLWEYKSDELHCELTEVPENYNEFAGALYHTFEEYAGHWISLKESLFNVYGSKPKERKKALTIPEPMKQPILKVCKDFGVGFQVKEVISGDKKGYANRPELKLLMFGNEDVSGYDYNSGQPYIIAEDFIANKK